MNLERLAEIRHILAGASPAPWEWVTESQALKSLPLSESHASPEYVLDGNNQSRFTGDHEARVCREETPEHYWRKTLGASGYETEGPAAIFNARLIEAAPSYLSELLAEVATLHLALAFACSRLLEARRGVPLAGPLAKTDLEQLCSAMMAQARLEQRLARLFAMEPAPEGELL
jgi:hypothetical protein